MHDFGAMGQKGLIEFKCHHTCAVLLGILWYWLLLDLHTGIHDRTVQRHHLSM